MVSCMLELSVSPTGLLSKRAQSYGILDAGVGWAFSLAADQSTHMGSSMVWAPTARRPALRRMSLETVCQNTQRGTARLLINLPPSPVKSLLLNCIWRMSPRTSPCSWGGGREFTLWWGEARSLSRRACDMVDTIVAIFGKCKLSHFISQNPPERTCLWLSSFFTMTG